MLNALLRQKCKNSKVFHFMDTGLPASDIGHDGVHLTSGGKYPGWRRPWFLNFWDSGFLPLQDPRIQIVSDGCIDNCAASVAEPYQSPRTLINRSRINVSPETDSFHTNCDGHTIERSHSNDNSNCEL